MYIDWLGVDFDVVVSRWVALAFGGRGSEVADLIVVSKGMLACERGVQLTGDKILVVVLIRSGVGRRGRVSRGMPGSGTLAFTFVRCCLRRRLMRLPLTKNGCGHS